MAAIYTKKDIVDIIAGTQDDINLDDSVVGEERDWWIDRINKGIIKEQERLMSLTDTQLIRQYRRQMGRINSFAPGLFFLADNSFDYRTILGQQINGK